jgi:hypothetical protein
VEFYVTPEPKIRLPSSLWHKPKGTLSGNHNSTGLGALDDNLWAYVNDCCLPISLALTLASLHDSQVAIPLIKLTSERVDYLNDLTMRLMARHRSTL